MRVYVAPSNLPALYSSGTHVGSLVLLVLGALHLLPNRVAGLVASISLLFSRAYVSLSQSVGQN